MKAIARLSAIASLTLVGCSKVNFSTGPTAPFAQSTGGGISAPAVFAYKDTFRYDGSQPKVDILWVVDNSSSMAPFQANLVANFNSFIADFQTRRLDFQLAVTTTDAYRAGPKYASNPGLARFRDGLDSTSHTKQFILTPATLNLQSTFVINASQGDQGSGDERAFSSIVAALESPLNAGFIRANSFLAVIILSDEDDFSDDTRAEGDWSAIPDHDYNNPNLIPVETFQNYLSLATGSSQAHLNYGVSAIGVFDSACLKSHSAESPSTILGVRYKQIVKSTGGVASNICATNFSQSLAGIGQNIINKVQNFYLTHKADLSSIQVKFTPDAPYARWRVVNNQLIFDVAPAAGTMVEVDYRETQPAPSKANN